jgi:hypothetical protein
MYVSRSGGFSHGGDSAVEGMASLMGEHARQQFGVRRGNRP